MPFIINSLDWIVTHGVQAARDSLFYDPAGTKIIAQTRNRLSPVEKKKLKLSKQVESLQQLVKIGPMCNCFKIILLVFTNSVQYILVQK